MDGKGANALTLLTLLEGGTHGVDGKGADALT